MTTDNTKEELARRERELYRRSIFNWDCLAADDVRVLVHNVRQATELGRLAYKGLTDRSPDCLEDELVEELWELASQGAFVLARKLGAIDEGGA